VRQPKCVGSEHGAALFAHAGERIASDSPPYHETALTAQPGYIVVHKHSLMLSGLRLPRFTVGGTYLGLCSCLGALGYVIDQLRGSTSVETT
jgi:hypothetical protein